MSAYDQMVKDAIVTHYVRQSGKGGSEYPVFRGSQVQYGNGIGDIFRSIGRFLLPIFASSAKSFVQSTAKGMESGRSIGEAAKQAIKPTVTSTVVDTSERAMRKILGAGRKSKPKKPRKRAAKKRKPVYKGGAKRKSNPKFNASKFSTLNF